MTSPPILSLTSPNIIHEISTACSTWGGFVLLHHGIDPTLLDHVISTGQSFFHLPQHIKDRYALTQFGSQWRGYMPRGGERSRSGSIEDAKEGLYMGEEHSLHHPKRGLPTFGSNVFPEEHVLPGMKELFLKYNREMKCLGDKMMRLLSLSLDLEETTIEERVTERNPTILPRMFRYCPSSNNHDECGIGEHSDYGLWTMILTNAPGLEFQHPQTKQWHAVPFVRHGIVMNVGDVLDRLSCGRFVSPYHRARNLSSEEFRLSLPYFYDPAWDAKMKFLPIANASHYDTPERRERWSNTKITCDFDGSVPYSEFLAKKVAKVFPDLIPEEYWKSLKSTSEPSTRHALVVDTSNEIITDKIRHEVVAFYQRHSTIIKESHGIKHVMAVFGHAQKAVRVHVPQLSSVESMKVLVASLLHDVDDGKYFPHHDNFENAREIMTCVGLDESLQSSVVEMISFVSCSKNKNNVPAVVSTNNAYWMLIPRWADRLEAIGRIGVLRCYQYNREIGAPLSSENSPCPKSIEEVWDYAKPERFEAYNGDSPDMISHYYDKLLHVARPPQGIVCNSYLEQATLESCRELMEVCLRYGRTGKVDEEYIRGLKA
jgi:isopenicillin N synthase-like dioxygenase